jgi:hypothetical protein
MSSATMEHRTKSVSIATSRPYLLQHSGFRVPDLRFEVSGLKFFWFRVQSSRFRVEV